MSFINCKIVVRLEIVCRFVSNFKICFTARGKLMPKWNFTVEKLTLSLETIISLSTLHMFFNSVNIGRNEITLFIFAIRLVILIEFRANLGLLVARSWHSFKEQCADFQGYRRFCDFCDICGIRCRRLIVSMARKTCWEPSRNLRWNPIGWTKACVICKWG